MTRSAFSAALALACIGFAATASAQSLSRSALTPGTQLQSSWTGPLIAQTITQSTAMTVVAGSISCNAGSPGFLHTDNSYYRAFTLSAFPALTQPQFRVDTINFGVETANDAAGAGQPLTINLWRSSANPPTLASLTAVSSDTYSIPDSASGTVFSANIASQPVFTVATDILVVEIFTPSGQAAGHSFFIGSNAAGQSGPSFIRAASCSVNDITNLGSIGFPNMHIAMSVSGNNQVPVTLQSYEVQ